MKSSLVFLPHHRPVIASFLRLGAGALAQRLRPAPTRTWILPGPAVEQEVEPLPESLLRAYARHVGDTTTDVSQEVPFHLFPQWAFGATGTLLASMPYPLLRVMNAGCRVERLAAIPAGRPLVVRTRLEAVDEDDRRALVTLRSWTSVGDTPCLDASFTLFLPLAPRGGSPTGAAERKATSSGGDAPYVVPSDAEEVDTWQLSDRDGLRFALLTGDFNPIHWIPAYAKVSGFPSTILHGFGAMCRAMATLEGAARQAGRPAPVGYEARFTKPLVLPARVHLFRSMDAYFVGTATGERANLVGRVLSR